MNAKSKSLLFTSVALSSLCFSFSAVADITLNVPSDVTILAVNEREAELEGGLFTSTKSLTLPNGENQIVFKYETSFEDDDEKTYVHSDVIIAKFNNADSTLTFEVPEYRNLRTAELNIKKMEWSLINEGGEAIPVVQDKLKKTGMQIGRDYIREIRDYNAEQIGVATLATSAYTATSLPVSEAKTNQGSTTVDETPSTSNSATTAEEMLYFWYEKADPETKQRFKNYINQQ